MRNMINFLNTKMIFIFYSIIILVSWDLCAQKQILPDFYADPSARVFNGKVWIYPLHDIAGSKWLNMIVYILTINAASNPASLLNTILPMP